MKNLSTAHEGKHSSFLSLITSYLSLIISILMSLLCYNMTKKNIYICVCVCVCVYIKEKIYTYIKELKK